MQLQVLRSEIDASVNFVIPDEVGFVESRYVRRRASPYFICYLSSQTACNRGCRFCHLTATGQTVGTDVSTALLFVQAGKVLRHWQSLGQPASFVHFNFMARGEFLANRSFVRDGDQVLRVVGDLASEKFGLASRFNVSTIMPLTFEGSLVDTFQYITPTIYYSFYSTDDSFRRKWMPGAMRHDEALRRLKEYQEFSQKRLRIHLAFIAGENDSCDNVFAIDDALRRHDIAADVNIVRYNPPDETSSETSIEQLDRLVVSLRARLQGRGTVQVVPRVGYDVKASCGMFMQSNTLP